MVLDSQTIIGVFLKTFIDFFKNNPIFIVVVVLGFLLTIFHNKLMGMIGEFWVKQELKKLDTKSYLTINDVTVRTADNHTHQIDHLVISKFGLFVIETKHYAGYIKGNEFDGKLKLNNKKYIDNPFHQNYGHIKALEEVLQIEENKFISIVCISGGATVKVNTTKNNLARLGSLNSIIKKYSLEILPNYEDVYYKVLSLNITDKEEKKQHVRDVKQIKKEKEIPKGDNICPWCGGQLVERNGKRGKFLGCSNFPKCRFTKNI